MHKNATKCNGTLSKWCKNKHGASKIIDTFETYHKPPLLRDREDPGALPGTLLEAFSTTMVASGVMCE
jgi:hypothetical protein